MSTAPVTPAAAYAASVLSTSASRSASVVAASRCAQAYRVAAVSSSSPVGSPSESRTISPPIGSGVSLVMPSSASAAVFSQHEW